MAKIIYLCLRDPESMTDFPERIELLSRRLVPDNIKPNPPIILKNQGIWIGVINPTTKFLTHGTSICIGSPIFIPDDWWKPGGKDPDGTYALFRSDQNFVEIGSDVVASRTIWYCLTDKFLIASSSQRAIVSFLGDFQVNKLAFPYMLASGVLGPNYSWDERIHYIESDEHLKLNRRTWQIFRNQVDFELQPVNRSRNEHKTLLKTALKRVFEDIDFDSNKWLLTLSGGLDSRGILAMLENKKEIKCVTWGPKSSLADPHSDAAIAEKVAAEFQVKQQFFETDPPLLEKGETILDRFIEAGEGRIDHFSGYRDGFQIWKKIFETGCSGIIRGDQFLGAMPITTDKNVLANMNYHILSDYSNLPSNEYFGLPEQILPDKYLRRPNESITAWAYRIRRNIKMVNELAALNEIKTGYVEVMNPLLSRRVINIIKTIPYQLNQNRKLFREIISEISPKIEFSIETSGNTEEILREPFFLNPILKELKSEEIKKWVSKNLIEFILSNFQSAVIPQNKANWELVKQKIKKFFPGITGLTKIFARKINLDYRQLAFRTFIISRMCKLLSEDANLFKTE